MSMKLSADSSAGSARRSLDTLWNTGHEAVSKLMDSRIASQHYSFLHLETIVHDNITDRTPIQYKASRKRNKNSTRENVELLHHHLVLRTAKALRNSLQRQDDQRTSRLIPQFNSILAHVRQRMLWRIFCFSDDTPWDPQEGPGPAFSPA